MKPSEAPSLNDVDPSIREELSARGYVVESVRWLGGGRNSRVLLLDAGEQRLVLKSYPRHAGDERDRLGSEVGVLNFMHHQGIEQVPAPLFWNGHRQWAAFSWLEGRPIQSANLSVIQDVAVFLGRLKKLSDIQEAAQLPMASESCFSLEAHLHLVSHRIRRLEGIEVRSPIHGKALTWAKESVMQEWQKTLERITREPSTLEMHEEIPAAERVLSPSDVGIHNMLKLEDGYGYLDFEYAGWDDPAKFAVDWILQPDHPLDAEKAEILMEAVESEICQGRSSLRRRILRLLGIYRLKWCAIMLNAFLKERRNISPEGLSIQLERTQEYFEKSMHLVTEIREVNS